ncbi:MAG: LamG domain-containing protein [Proteiniphilum sp.]|nr:LamG domain-containing protein [Proteiniphilum sp.]
MEFDGGGSVTVPHNNIFNITDAITISVRIKITDTSEPDYGQFMTKGNGYAWFLGVRRSDGYTVWYSKMDGGTNNNWLIGRFPELVDGNWHHIVFTYDKDAGENNQRFYIDGVLRNQKTTTGTFDTTTNPLSLVTSSFKGGFRDARIYNRQLTDNEVVDLFEGKSVTDGLVGHWEMNEGTGNIAYDSSPNNNNGVIVGALWKEDIEQVDKISQLRTNGDLIIYGKLVEGTEVADSLLKLSNGVVSIGDIVENYDFTFKPLSMKGIQAYFDASVLDVGNVPIWEDLTGNGNNLVASSNNTPVVIPSSLNGLNTLAFDVTPMVFSSTFKIQPNASIYMIVKSNSAGGALQTIMGTQGITAVVAPRFYIAYENSYLMRTQGRQTFSGVTIQDEFVVFGVRHNEVGDMVLQVNETIVEAAGHITEYDDTVVQLGFGSYRGFNGEIGELIIFNRMLNDKEHNALYAYLREKWGV